MFPLLWERLFADFAHGGLPSAMLRVEGGDIAVACEELPEGGLRVVSTGRVREGEAVLAARREVSTLSASERKR